MSDTPNQQFKITVPITKCYLRKTADGVERYVVEGMASNTDMDLTGERMAETAIKSMAASLATHPVLFKNEHGDEWDAEFGEVTALYATEAHQLMMEAELDPDHYRTKTLVKALEKGKSLGLSIGGIIPEGGAVKEWVSELGRIIKTYKDILLQEISVTGSPAVADTWLTNITKSVKDWKETPMPKPNHDKPVAKTEEQEVVEQTPTETPEAPIEEPTLAEGQTPEAPKSDTPNESDAKDPSDADVTPAPETPPAPPEAPEQTEDTPASAESTPDPAEEDTSEVAKSAVFGNWAEVGMTVSAIESLSWTLQDHIWLFLTDDDSATEKAAKVDAALTDYHTLVMKVVSALATDSPSEEVQRAASDFKANTPEAVSKSLTEKDTKVEELTKSLTDKTTELETVQKSLADKTAEFEKTAKELEKVSARKTLVFGRGYELGDSETTEKSDETSIGELYLQKIGAIPDAA